VPGEAGHITYRQLHVPCQPSGDALLPEAAATAHEWQMEAATGLRSIYTHTGGCYATTGMRVGPKFIRQTAQGVQNKGIVLLLMSELRPRERSSPCP
jgi:hypothetical protein